MGGKLNFHYFSTAMKTHFFKLFLVVLSFTSAGQSLNVISYNIRYDNPKDGINQWSSRKEKVYALLTKYDPDLLGVQEALNHQLKDIQANLPQYDFIGAGRDDGKEKGEYSAIFYKKDRFEVLEQNTFWLSETPEVPGSKNWDAAITRVATWARLRDKKNSREFLIINTHFDHVGKEARKKSAELLKMQAGVLAKEFPVIITGDFNCTRDESPYLVMMDKSHLELIDPAPKNDPPGTFCNFGVNSQPCRAIDYIFYTNDWTPEAYNVYSDSDGKNYPSDHLPVQARLSLKK
jgi:endonuclease/exonuclease/phosphatase family metal-dependent hydrolase